VASAHRVAMCLQSAHRARRDAHAGFRDRHLGTWAPANSLASWLPHHGGGNLPAASRATLDVECLGVGAHQDAERALRARDAPNRVSRWPHRDCLARELGAWTRPSCAGATSGPPADSPYELRIPYRATAPKPLGLLQVRLQSARAALARGGLDACAPSSAALGQGVHRFNRDSLCYRWIRAPLSCPA